MIKIRPYLCISKIEHLLVSVVFFFHFFFLNFKAELTNSGIHNKLYETNPDPKLQG